jgi:hypothetical protein
MLTGCAELSRTRTSVAARSPTQERAKEEATAIGAIRVYLDAVRSHDFGVLYDRHFHSAAKARTTRDEFIQHMQDGFAATLEQLCAEILTEYQRGGLRSGTLTIGPTQYPLVPGIELARKKRVPDEGVIKPGNAFRIQIAPDPKDLKFYDID